MGQAYSSTPTIYRANLQRTGRFETRGLHRIKGLKWAFNITDHIDPNTSVPENEDNKWIRSTPIIVDDTLVFGTGTGHFICVDISSGKLRRSVVVEGSISSAVTVIGEHAYVNHNGLSVIKYDGGQTLWHQPISTTNSSPTVSDKIIYIGTMNGLVAFNITDGHLIWRSETQTPVYCTPAISDGVIVYGRKGFDGSCLYADAATSGRSIWRFNFSPGKSSTIAATPVIVECRVFFKSRDGNLYAIDLETGRELWRNSNDFRENSSPTFIDNILLSNNSNGTLFAVDTRTGQSIWTFDMAEYRLRYTGETDWSNSSNYFSPISADGCVYSACGNILFGIDMKTGQELWHYIYSAPINAVTIYDGVVYCGAENGCLVALE